MATVQQAEYQRRMQKALIFIDNHITDPLRLEDIASAANFSKYHFHRLFTAITGETPADYILRLKLEKAANQILTYSEKPVSAIAYDCGFSSPAFFSRVFRQRFGFAPTEFSANSKNSKAFSNTGKALGSEMDYFSDVNKISKENMMSASIRVLPKLHVASVTSSNGYNDSIGLAYNKLMAWAGMNNLFSRDTQLLGIPLDNPDITSSDKCRYKACMTIPESVKSAEDIEVLDIPGQSYAVLSYNGSEEGINSAYNYLYKQFLPDNGLAPSDSPSYEKYYQPPTAGKERIFVMDICIPVEAL